MGQGNSQERETARRPAPYSAYPSSIPHVYSGDASPLQAPPSQVHYVSHTRAAHVGAPAAPAPHYPTRLMYERPTPQTARQPHVHDVPAPQASMKKIDKDEEEERDRQAAEWEALQLEWAMKESMETHQVATASSLTHSPIHPPRRETQTGGSVPSRKKTAGLSDIPTVTAGAFKMAASSVDEWVKSTLPEGGYEPIRSPERGYEPISSQRSRSSSESIDDLEEPTPSEKSDTPGKKKQRKRHKKKTASESKEQPVSTKGSDTVGFTEAVKTIMAALLRNDGKSGFMLLKTRANQSKDFRDYIADKWGTLMDFLLKHPGLFSVIHEGGDKGVDMVILRTEMRLCHQYVMPAGCPRGDRCQDLHMCRDLLLTTCAKEDRCQYNHLLENDHNQAVMRAHFCEGLLFDKIQMLLKASRTRATVPDVCKMYNTQKECPNFNQKNKGFCSSMHVCFYFLKGQCKFGESCKRSHNIRSPQPMGVLKKYGYDVKPQDEMIVLEELRQVYSQNERAEHVHVSQDGHHPGAMPAGKQKEGKQHAGKELPDEMQNRAKSKPCQTKPMEKSPVAAAHPHLDELNIDTVVSCLVREVCELGGRATLMELMAGLRRDIALWAFVQGRYGSVDAFLDDYGDTFSLTSDDNSQEEVHIKTRLQVCLKHHSRGGCKNKDCPDLHVCRYFLLGNCYRGAGKRGAGDKQVSNSCPQGHLLFDPRNQAIIKKYHLDLLSFEQARKVLKENRSRATVPQVCQWYNSPRGHQLAQGQRCSKLHVCFYYVKGTCRRGEKCQRPHSFKDTAARQILQQYGFSPQQNHEDIRRQIQEVLERSVRDNEEEEGGSDSDESLVSVASLDSMASLSTPFKETTNLSNQICLLNLVGKCKFGKKCKNRHAQDPYVWQYKDGGEWVDFPEIENCRLEKLFSDPQSTTCPLQQQQSKSTSQPGQRWVDFITMEYIDRVKEVTRAVRRLSTKSDLGGQNHMAGLTNWGWFWESENGQWREYGDKQGASDTAVSSALLEESYLKEPNGLFTFSAGIHDYVIHFKDMAQANLKIGTVRAVRRRPAFQSRTDLKAKGKGRTDSSSSASGATAAAAAQVQLPVHWQLKADANFNLVEVQDRSSPEFQLVNKLFHASMPNALLIKKLKRVENRELYEN